MMCDEWAEKPHRGWWENSEINKIESCYPPRDEEKAWKGNILTVQKPGVLKGTRTMRRVVWQKMVSWSESTCKEIWRNTAASRRTSQSRTEGLNSPYSSITESSQKKRNHTNYYCCCFCCYLTATQYSLNEWAGCMVRQGFI